MKNYKLYAPKQYWTLTKTEKEKICNGCGAKGGVNVPNTMWGLNIKKACNIHDFMFEIGKTYADFLFANAMFIFNLTVIIVSESNLFMSTLRLARATKYFIAVAIKGEKAFWKNKKQNADFNITYKGEFRDA